MLDAIEAAQSNDVLLFTIRYTEMRNGRMNARNKYGISVMERMARETGGADFDGQGKGLVEGFKQIGDQLRASYELAYHTSNPPGDKTFHKIVIRSKQPDLTVRAKSGYYAR
jgi:Ca-activated chloride channel family protein